VDGSYGKGAVRRPRKKTAIFESLLICSVLSLSWTELFENKPLENTLVLITYRIESGQPLDMSHLKQVECIESLPFSLETIEHLLVTGFHLKEKKPEDGFSVLSSFLYNATKGIAI
jgi:hypothetical protein